MTKKIIFLFFTICSVGSIDLFSQESTETPIHFGQFYNNPLLNLSRGGLDSKFELNMDNQRNVGGFSGVSTSYLSFFYYPNYRERSSPKLNSKNIYGIYFYNDREGDFLFRRRAQFSFARHQKINEKWSLSLALSAGIYIFGIKPTNTTGAYSSNSFEGNSSLLFYSDKFQFGLSMNQFTNSTIQPVSQIMRLKRHYYLFSQYKWETEKVVFLPSFFLRYMNIDDPLIFTKKTTGGVSIRGMFNILMAGVCIDNYGLYFTTGLNDWNINKLKLNIDFSYFVPTVKFNANVNRMELNLKIKI